MAKKREICFKVFRFDPDKDRKPYFQKFQVPFVRKDLTVSEGLFYIQEKLDNSLAFRSSCRSAVCGSCAMHINDRYGLACNTLVSNLKGNKVTIRPLGHLDIIKDLFVDLEPFWKKYEFIKPYLISKTLPSDHERLQTHSERAKLDGLIDCILCGCCYSSCMVTLTNDEYLGPAALLWVNRFYVDSRDDAQDERLGIVNVENGVWRCHAIFNCHQSCPKSLNPAGCISNLKMKLI
ncbi:MAG: succinate dehydrogenase iron-sulfur protein [Candidatus Scalindua rubra]|uniref:Succinate dehydrogenase iron-sulfur protein n=1 Tax=Candidatus Scalindua rubra TaxID=1872076 RepID=A0A1E3XF06_9BACT|nr:MAG: succinate dehydrogenase iron-sulfur protein [Candidatus Scalindua rubra]